MHDRQNRETVESHEIVLTRADGYECDVSGFAAAIDTKRHLALRLAGNHIEKIFPGANRVTIDGNNVIARLKTGRLQWGLVLNLSYDCWLLRKGWGGRALVQHDGHHDDGERQVHD